MRRKALEARSRQILRWCEASWPTPYPVKLTWKDELLDKDEKFKKDQPYHGETYLHNGVLRIDLSRKKCSTYSNMIDTMLHEYGHCRDWRHARLERDGKRKIHGPEWGLFYAEIYDLWHDEGGWHESKDY